MTCKCGGEFCYICGAVWQTCHCTEDDELVRQEELRQRREQQQGESAEIARAIAEVEALERIEAERRQQEEREEEERRQAELARLEAERLREEEARRREELRLEREFRKTLRISVEQACEALQSALEDVLRVQRTSLDSRHINLEKQYFQRCNAEVDEQQTSMETMMTALESHISGRIKALEESHEAELRAFDAKLQELEDDFFLEMQTHLRGKSDREGRERRLQDRFNKQQDAKREDIFGRQESEMEVVKAKAALEVRGLTRAQRQQVASLQATHATQLKALLAMVAADRAWYDFLSERRLNMVTEHTRLMLEAVGAGQEPVGLTEERAMAIRPFIRTDGRVEEAINDPSLQSTNRVPEADQHLPSHQKAPSSRVSTPSPSESLVDLVNTSRCLLNILEVHSNAELSHQASLDRARAWVAKTSGEVPLRQVEPRPKGSEPSQASGSGSRSNNSRVAAKPSTGEPMYLSPPTLVVKDASGTEYQIPGAFPNSNPCGRTRSSSQNLNPSRLSYESTSGSMTTATTAASTSRPSIGSISGTRPMTASTSSTTMAFASASASKTPTQPEPEQRLHSHQKSAGSAISGSPRAPTVQPFASASGPSSILSFSGPFKPRRPARGVWSILRDEGDYVDQARDKGKYKQKGTDIIQHRWN